VIRKVPLRLIAGPIATVVLIAAAGQVLWNNFERTKEAGSSVEHTYRVLVASEHFLSTIRDAESSLRGYVITRNPRYRPAYYADLSAIETNLALLEELTRDNPQQKGVLNSIRDLTAQRIATMNTGLKAVDEGRFDLIQGMIPRGQGPKIMAELTSQVSLFEEQEHRLLASRTEAANRAASHTQFLLICTSTLLAVALLLAGAVAERHYRNREASYEASQRQADLINFSHDAIVTLNPAGVITGWNAGATEIYGWTSAEALGRPAKEILISKDQSALADINATLSQTGRWDGELIQTTKDRQIRVVESRYVQVRNRAGESLGVLNISRDETQRRRAEELLRQVAEQRRLALDAADLGSWDYRVAEDRVVWDERCREIMGLPGLGPATFEQALKMVHPDERATVRDSARRAMSGEDDGRFTREMRIVLRDGSVRWLATHGRVYFEEIDNVKRPVRVIGVNRDITDRKHAEEALGQSEDRLRVALDTGRIGIFDDIPLEGKIIFDDRAKRLLGVPTSANVDIHYFLGILHPEDRERLRQARDSDLAAVDEDPGELEYRVVRPDGEVRWLIARRRPYFEGEGAQRRVIRVSGILLDITQQKRAEQRLAEALGQSDRERRRLATLLETMPAGVVLADRTNKVLEANAEAVHTWRAKNISELAARGLNFIGRRADSGEPLRMEDWPRGRALRGETVRGEVIDIERFDGTPGTLINSASPIRDANGEIQGAVSVMVDITKQRQIELALRKSEDGLRQAHKQLEQLLEQKNILFREVQHRVKNNLQVVSSLLSLEAQRFEDREFHHALNESCDRVRSMALMHEKFYHLDDLARIEFREYVDELARYFFSSYTEQGAIRFTADVDVRLSMDEAIPCGLILQELLSNSVKHAFPQGRGEICIDFHSTGGRFEMRYRDNGVGLPKRVNLENPESLGLQLVSDLANQLRGSIGYQYQEGAVFTLQFA